MHGESRRLVGAEWGGIMGGVSSLQPIRESRGASWALSAGSGAENGCWRILKVTFLYVGLYDKIWGFALASPTPNSGDLSPRDLRPWSGDYNMGVEKVRQPNTSCACVFSTIRLECFFSDCHHFCTCGCANEYSTVCLQSYLLAMLWFFVFFWCFFMFCVLHIVCSFSSLYVLCFMLLYHYAFCGYPNGVINKWNDE